MDKPRLPKIPAIPAHEARIQAATAHQRAKAPSAGRFPRQDGLHGRRVTVCFDYDTATTIGGEIVRSDAEPPGLTIIRLDDGRHVLSTECQYRL